MDVIAQTRATSRADAASGPERDPRLEFLASVLGAASYGVVVLDGCGTVATVSSTALDLIGLHEIELVGSPLDGLVADEDLAWILDRPAGDRRRTVTLLHGSERAFRADATVVPLEGDGAGRAVLMFRSVEAELEAHEIADRAVDLLAATPDLVMWADDAGGVEYLNAGGRSLLGVDDPGSLSVADVFPAWAADLFDRDIRPALDAEGSWTGDLMLQAADGREIPATTTFLVQREETGFSLAILARDQRPRHELDRLHDAFVSTVSHELRTPLASILGYLEMFADGDFGAVGPEQVSALETMRRNGSRLMGLVDELLRIASIGETGLLDPVPVDLAAIVERVASESASPERLTLSVQAEGPVVSGSEEELASMVESVIENGLKFSGDTETVAVRISRIDPWVEMVVEDRGVGIPGAELESVFDRFFRASNARELEAQGAGLGLAIARAIARKHGGEIAIASELGSGTVTRILLPAADTESRR